ncbi:TetR/AcrR family transcriptional regulator [Neobacillus sp. Marseille-QA0830]
MEQLNQEINYLDRNLQIIQSSTKNKILDIAMDFFSKKGYTGASIRDITKQVGIKESSLYKHFKNKEEILEIIFLNFREDVLKILPPEEHLDYIIKTMTPMEFLEKGVSNFMKHINQPTMQKIWRIIYIEQYREPKARDIYLTDILGRTIRFLEKAFSKMIEQNKIKTFNPKTLAVEYQYPVFTMITEYNMLKFYEMDTKEVEAKIANHIVFFWEAVKR